MGVFSFTTSLENVFVKGVSITTDYEFAGFLIVLATLSIVHEGVGFFKSLWLNRFIKTGQEPSPQKETVTVRYVKKDEDTSTPHSCSGDDNDKPQIQDVEIVDNNISAERANNDNGKATILRHFCPLISSSILYTIQLCLGFNLMMAIMTFNFWVLCAIAFGAGVGFLFSDYLRHRVV